jgi:PAS domain S-box-containing protein
MTNDIIEASLDPLFVIGESGTIRRVNHASVTLFGFTEDELVGHNILKIVGGGHAKNHDQFLQNYLANGRTKVIGKRRQLPARRKDGSEFPIQLTVVEMKTSDDEERMFCGFMHDLSQIKSNESISNGIIESSLDAMFLIRRPWKNRYGQPGSSRYFRLDQRRIYGWKHQHDNTH